MLASYREAEDIPADVEARIWSVVGSDDVLEPEHATDDVPRVDHGARRTLGWVGFGVAAAAVLVVAWQLGGQRAERARADADPGAAAMQHERTPNEEQATPRTPAPARAVEPVDAVPPERPEPPMPSVDDETEPAEAPPDPAPHAKARAPRRAPSEPAEAPSPSSLTAERDLIARAWRSLAHGDEAAALATVAEHRQRFAQGLLAPEREAVEVIARCRRGDADGPRRAASFHREHPRSPLAGRVDEACVPERKK